MNTKKIISSIAALVTIASVAILTPVLAEQYGYGSSSMGSYNGYGSSSFMGSYDNKKNNDQPHNNVNASGHFNFGQLNFGQMKKMSATVYGTVSNISGDILTVTVPGRFGLGENHFGTSTATTTRVMATSTLYTVDATNAKVFKNNASTTVATIAVGDMIYAQGTENASTTNSIVATTIFDIVPPQLKKGNKNNDNDVNQNTILDNGQPIIMGSVSVVSTSTLTVTSSNITYTVDVTTAKILQANNASSTISNITVGDKVLVQGTVNGTSITASSVIDQNQSNPASKNKVQGFFKSIGSFFSKWFRF